MKKFFYILLFCGFSQHSIGQQADAKTNYEKAFDEMHRMLKDEVPISFKRAVFLTENSYLDNQMDYDGFEKHINGLVQLTRSVSQADGLIYNKKDRQQVLLSASLYRVMKDTILFESPYDETKWRKLPYTYDMDDFSGSADWTKMFVSKLFYSKSGNCHSLPILYKILADELGVKAWLSITPNHTYIKQWNDKTGWYNTELTTGRFPYDAEIKNNSYIKTEAIVAGVYMDTLTNKENISYAITDLALGYIKKFGYDDIETPVRWLDTALVYYPDFPNALIFKSELLKKNYEKAVAKKGGSNYLNPKDIDLRVKFEELEKSYYTVHQTGYRRMPKEMYLNWLYRVRKDTTRKPHRFESPQPFKDYGYKVLVMTASDGYNYEFYDQEETTRIGTVEINRLTGKIVKFIEPEKDDFSDEIISRMYDPYVGRFWQIDPHAETYYSLSPYTAFANNPILFNDPDGRDIVFYILSGDQENSELKKVKFSQLDKNFQKALIAFAKTKEGNAYLSQFANKGDKIGDVEFKSDGKFAKHDLGLTQESQTYGSAGRSSFTWGKDEDGSTKAEFYLTVNTKNADGDRDETSMALTFGHEAFIHLDQYDDRAVDAANRNDKSALGKLATERMQIASDRQGGKDHDAYLRGDSQYQRMNTYTSQLKAIYNPTSVDKAKKSHDQVVKKSTQRQ
jgi:RHS repeat-associated protein